MDMQLSLSASQRSGDEGNGPGAGRVSRLERVRDHGVGGGARNAVSSLRSAIGLLATDVEAMGG